MIWETISLCKFIFQSLHSYIFIYFLFYPSWFQYSWPKKSLYSFYFTSSIIFMKNSFLYLKKQKESQNNNSGFLVWLFFFSFFFLSISFIFILFILPNHHSNHDAKVCIKEIDFNIILFIYSFLFLFLEEQLEKFSPQKMILLCKPKSKKKNGWMNLVCFPVPTFFLILPILFTQSYLIHLVDERKRIVYEEIYPEGIFHFWGHWLSNRHRISAKQRTQSHSCKNLRLQVGPLPKEGHRVLGKRYFQDRIHHWFHA